ncbi:MULTISPECIES: hypothetical protein [Candidatus Nitrosocaldus]|jgi:hypothetical protein|uniref:Uncharacterized protein n=1 Tax=Candidatus Nitrosocaldus cavascurensis TaxID=2058097 RepID=A0A2K5ASL2_9ARCH|nr:MULTISPECIES: hypothetical protein [Candidatus Nitrosocaldus]GBC74398.1 hypothetical protein HRbin05_00438 [archaeon HR05]SPC34640.1 conserved protein of unknown function [Candidatus Nitrosocaldus cavascurensis]
MRWGIEQEEYYFKIYDEDKNVAAYFQPDYGQIEPKEREYEIIERMLKHGDPITSGLLYMPMAKFNIRDDADYSIDDVISSIEDALSRIKQWRGVVGMRGSGYVIEHAWVRRAHTDYDMLAILLVVRFNIQVRLFKKEILNALAELLDLLVDNGLI